MSTELNNATLFRATLGAVLLVGGLLLVALRRRIARWLFEPDQSGAFREWAERHHRGALLLMGVGAGSIGLLAVLGALWGNRAAALGFGAILFFTGGVGIILRKKLALYRVTDTPFPSYSDSDLKEVETGILLASLIAVAMGVIAGLSSLAGS